MHEGSLLILFCLPYPVSRIPYSNHRTARTEHVEFPFLLQWSLDRAAGGPYQYYGIAPFLLLLFIMSIVQIRISLPTPTNSPPTITIDRSPDGPRKYSNTPIFQYSNCRCMPHRGLSSSSLVSRYPGIQDCMHMHTHMSLLPTHRPYPFPLPHL